MLNSEYGGENFQDALHYKVPRKSDKLVILHSRATYPLVVHANKDISIVSIKLHANFLSGIFFQKLLTGTRQDHNTDQNTMSIQFICEKIPFKVH